MQTTLVPLYQRRAFWTPLPIFLRSEFENNLKLFVLLAFVFMPKPPAMLTNFNSTLLTFDFSGGDPFFLLDRDENSISFLRTEDAIGGFKFFFGSSVEL